MKKTTIIFFLAVITVWFAAGNSSAAGPITVNLYDTYSSTADGTPFSGLQQTFTSQDIMFGSTAYDSPKGYSGTEPYWNWYPLHDRGIDAFGAEITGLLSVAASGNYTFGLQSDDGSSFYIGKSLVIDNGGEHGVNLVQQTLFLNQGVYQFTVNFFENGYGESGVDLYLPRGVSYANVPLPASFLLLAPGLMGLAAVKRRFRK